MTTAVTPRHGFHLGKLDPTPPRRQLRDVLATPVTPPPNAHYGYKVPPLLWYMDGNGPDPTITLPGTPPGWGGAGDCVEAFKAHALTTGNYWEHGHTVPVPTGNAVVSQYCAYQGCTPQQLFDSPDQFDQGEDMSTSLEGWETTEQYGTKLYWTAGTGITQNDIKEAIYLGGAGIGIQVQEAQEDQFPNEWEWVPGSPIMGGHAVWLTGYTKTTVYLITWGKLIAASWNFIMNAIDEAHVLVLPQAAAYGKGPQGLLIAAIEAAAGTIPPS